MVKEKKADGSVIIYTGSGLLLELAAIGTVIYGAVTHDIETVGAGVAMGYLGNNMIGKMITTLDSNAKVEVKHDKNKQLSRVADQLEKLAEYHTKDKGPDE